MLKAKDLLIEAYGMQAIDAKELVKEAFPPRKLTSHKGLNGIVAVIGGSKIYHGAPTLASLAALRTGVDLVYLAVPQPISLAVRAISPNLIVYPLPDAKLTKGCVNRLLKWLPEINSVAIGPGLGRQKTDGMKELIKEMNFRNVSVVLDADALHKEVVELLKGKKGVITPHAGEFKRVFGEDLPKDLDDKVRKVKERAKDFDITILLKGNVDIISDGEKLALNHTGSPAMTVGGTGDVLTGIVAGILSKGIDPFTACCAAAYVNGLAGERAASKYGLHIVATDLIEELPFILKEFDKIEE
jgi:NAD(P)H-hydrate epimerase